MANRTQITIIEDGWRNAIFHVGGVLDTANVAGLAINLSTFTNNDPGVLPKILKWLMPMEVHFGCSGLLGVYLDWEATANQLGPVMGSGGHICYGPGLAPSNAAAAGFTGNFLLSTIGFATAASFGLTVTCKKVYQ